MSVSRRTVIIGGAAAAGLVAVGAGTAIVQNLLPKFGTPGVMGLEPEIIRSQNGKLEIDLVAQVTPIKINGQTVYAKTYNGTLPGPTWLANPGDVITVNFTNRLGETTNLHTHGFHVSPEGNSDNVMLEIKDGETFTYEYTLASDHPTGTFWYHPHHHGFAADQVFAGLYGAIIIEEKQPIQNTFDRVLVISDIQFDSNGTLAQAGMMARMMGREGELVLVNGHNVPEFASLTNSRERWRIVNACTSRFVKLHVDGAQLTLLGMDSGQYQSPKTTTSIVLAPGNRADVFVSIGVDQVQLAFDSVPHPDAIMSTTPVKNQVIAKFTPGDSATGAGPIAADLVAVSTLSNNPRDMRTQPIAAKRNFSLEMPSMGGGMMMHDAQGNMTGFTINGAAFDMATVNTTVAMNTIEEWTITNTSNMSHPFHLHVWPMQLISVGDQVIDDPQWQDVVIVPPLGKSVVRVAFENHSGTAVYHCHILDHEDQGMMGIIRAN